MRPVRASILAVAGLATAFFAWRDAAAAYWLSAAPAQPPSIVADNPQIALARTDKALTGPDAVEPAVVRAVDAAARAALAAEPLNPMAVRQYALAQQLQMRGDYRQTLALAEQLSRRDAPTQVALLRLASNAGDYQGFVDHFDRLVSANPRSGASLYAAMGQSLADPRLRQELTRLSARPWFTGFLIAISRNREVDPAPVAAFLTEGRVRLDDRAAPAVTALVGRLLQQDDYAGARAVALTSGKTTQGALDDFALRARNADPAFAPLTWRIFATRVVDARFGEESTLDVELQPDSAATIADRVTHLPPGGYALTWTTANTSAAMGTQIQWRMACGAGDRAPQVWLGDSEIRANSQPDRAAVTIPANCPVQRWRLTASSAAQQAPAAFAIRDAELRRAP